MAARVLLELAFDLKVLEIRVHDEALEYLKPGSSAYHRHEVP